MGKRELKKRIDEWLKDTESQLDLAELGLAEWPKELNKYKKKIKNIVLFKNNLKEVPDLPNCEYIDFYGNKVTEMPSLPKAKIIICAENKIKVIGDLLKCTELDAGDCKLESIGKLPNCVILNVENNNLRKLPSLPACEQLNAGNNILESLPPLLKCVKVFFENNRIKKFPLVSAALEEVRYYGNPLENIPDLSNVKVWEEGEEDAEEEPGPEESDEDEEPEKERLDEGVDEDEEPEKERLDEGVDEDEEKSLKQEVEELFGEDVEAPLAVKTKPVPLPIEVDDDIDEEFYGDDDYEEEETEEEGVFVKKVPIKIESKVQPPKNYALELMNLVPDYDKVNVVRLAPIKMEKRTAIKRVKALKPVFTLGEVQKTGVFDIESTQEEAKSELVFDINKVPPARGRRRKDVVYYSPGDLKTFAKESGITAVADARKLSKQLSILYLDKSRIAPTEELAGTLFEDEKYYYTRDELTPYALAMGIKASGDYQTMVASINKVINP